MADDTITILAGILAVMVLIDHCRHIYVEQKEGRVPVFDTMDICLLIPAIALLLTIAAKLLSEGSG